VNLLATTLPFLDQIRTSNLNHFELTHPLCSGDSLYFCLHNHPCPLETATAYDLGHGQPVAIGQVDESNPQAVGRWLEPLVKRLGVSVIVTDDLASFRIFDWDKDVPWTNNGTEQSIGRMNMRSRTVRGYKSWPGMWAAFMLTGSGVSW